ncbi:transmembrane protein, putative, partial [Bodo saltans]
RIDQLDLELFSDLLTTSTPPALNNEQKEGDVERISTLEVNSDISDDALMKQRSQYGQTPPLFGVLHDKNGAQHDSSTTTTTTTSARSHHGGNTTEKEEFRVEDYFQEVQPFPEDADLSLPADQSSSDIDHRAKKRSSSLFLAMDVDDLFAGMQPAPLASLVSDPSRHHYDHDERKLDELAVVAIEELNTSNRQSDDNNEDVANNNNNNASKSKKKRFLQSRPETFQEALVRHAATIAFPSLLTLPACLLFDSTITFSVRLLVHPVDPNDILIGVVGLLVYGGLLIACIAFTLCVTRSPAPLKVRLTHPLVGSAKLRFLRYLFLPSHHYEPRRRRDRRQQNMMSYVLEEFRIPQFFCCDLALSALIASLAGVGISRRELCTKLAAVALAGHVVFFLAVIWLRPFTVRFAFGLAVAAAGLGVISSLFTLLSMSTGSLVLGTINQYAEIGMLWVSALGSIVTLISIVAYVRNRCAADRKSSGRKAASEEEKPHSVGFDDQVSRRDGVGSLHDRSLCGLPRRQ